MEEKENEENKGGREEQEERRVKSCRRIWEKEGKEELPNEIGEGVEERKKVEGNGYK
jgi:hypothetical protein